MYLWQEYVLMIANEQKCRNLAYIDIYISICVYSQNISIFNSSNSCQNLVEFGCTSPCQIWLDAWVSHQSASKFTINLPTFQLSYSIKRIICASDWTSAALLGTELTRSCGIYLVLLSFRCLIFICYS